VTDQPIAPPVDAPPPPETGAALTLRRISEERDLLPPVPRGLEGTSWALIQHAATLARLVSNSRFVPASFRGKPDSIAAAFLLCHELRVPPLLGLRQLHVSDEYPKVNSRTGVTETKGGEILIAAQLMRAVARRGGHRLWLSEYTTTRVTWNGQRAGAEETLSVTWTIDDAKRAKVYRADSAWEKTPRAMLSARASAELCRVVAEEELGGLYAVEEFRDDPTLIEEINSLPIREAGEQLDTEHTDEAPPEGATRPGTRRRSLKVIEAPQSAPEPQQAAAAAVEEVIANGGDVQPSAPADATPPAPVEPPTPPARAVRTRNQPVRVSTEPVIAVPGDELGPQGVGAGPTPEPSPGPTASAPDPLGSGGPATAAPSDAFLHMLKGKSFAQSVAIAARVAGIDRDALCKAVSGGRTGSARELNNEEATIAIDHARAIARGEESLLRGEIGERAFPKIHRAQLVADTKAALRLLYTHDRNSAYELMDALDPEWTAKGGLDAYLDKVVDQEAIATLRLKARLRLEAMARERGDTEIDPEES